MSCQLLLQGLKVQQQIKKMLHQLKQLNVLLENDGRPLR